MVTTITSWQVPSTDIIAEDMLEVYERIAGIDEVTGAPLRGISYAWAYILSQSNVQSNYDFSAITPPTVYDKVAGILLKDVYPLNPFNFVENSVSQIDVSNEESLKGLFGVTEDWIYTESGSNNDMLDAIEKIANYNGVETSEVRTALINKLKYFNEDLSGWNVNNVTNFYRTFYKLPAYNRPWSWASYNPGSHNHSATYKDMFHGAESMTYDIEFTDLVGSYPDQTERSITTQKFSNVMTGTQAELKVTNFEDLLYGFTDGSSVPDYVHNNATIRYYVALDISKDLTTEDVDGNKIINHRADIGAPDNWKTQNVTTIDSLFKSTQFNKEINNWDVSSVTTMQNAFNGNDKFNKPLDQWDTSSVTRTDNMFWGALAFAQNLGSWDTSRITHMDNMFRNGLKSTSMNPDYDLYKWDLSSLRSADMVFSHGAFNGRLQSLADKWISGQEYAEGAVVIHFEDSQKKMYRSKINANNHTPSGATDDNWELMSYDSSQTYSFFDFVWHNGKLYRFATDVPTWSSGRQFYLNGPNNLTFYQGKYYKSKDRTKGNVPDLSPSKWGEVSSALLVEDDNGVMVLNDLFWREEDPYKAIMGWDRSWNMTLAKDTVVQYESEFYRATVEKLRRDDDLTTHSSWVKLNEWSNTETYSEGDFVHLNDNVHKASRASTGVSPSTSSDDWMSVSYFDWNDVPRPSAVSLFYKTQSIHQPLEKLNMYGLTNFSNTFNEATKYNFPVDWNTSHATHFNNMFRNANSMNSKVTLDTSKARFMTEMFRDASNFNGEVQFNDVSNVESMERMFWGATAFNKPLNFNNGETEVDTKSLTNLGGMFFAARAFNQPVPFDVSRVTDFSRMFSGANSFDQDLSGWTKNSTNSFITNNLSTVSVDRRIFVDDIYRDDNQKRRYVIIQREDVDANTVQFTTTLYEDEIERKKYVTGNLAKADCHDLDSLNVNFAHNFGMEFEPVFIHYGKRIDIMVITDYPKWENGETYDSGAIVLYNDKYYKSNRKVVNSASDPENSSDWVSYYFYPIFDSNNAPYSANTYVYHNGNYYLSSTTTSAVPGADSDWVFEHHVGDSVQVDILSKFYTENNNLLRDEKLTYVTFGKQDSHTGKTYVFYSSQYVYSFKTSKVPSSNVFKDKLQIDYHNNPYQSSYGKYRGLIEGPEQTVSDVNVYYTNRTRDMEQQEDLMTQTILTANRLANNFLSVLYKRYRLPEVSSVESERGDMTSMAGSIVRISENGQWSYYRVKADGLLEDASYSFQNTHDDLYVQNTRVIAEKSSGHMCLYKANSSLSLEPSNDSELWEEVTENTENASVWSKDDFSYPQNSIVKLDSNYYQSSSTSLRSVKVDEDVNWASLSVSEWAENTQYPLNTLVEESNLLYKSLYPNNGSKPGTIGANTTSVNDLNMGSTTQKRVFPQNVYYDPANSSTTTRFVAIERSVQGTTVNFTTKIYENNVQVGVDYLVQMDASAAYESDELDVMYETGLNGSTNILIFIHYGSRVDIHVMDTNRTRHVDVLQAHQTKLGDEKLKYFGFASQHGVNYILYFRSNKHVYSMHHKDTLDYSGNSISFNWRYHNNPTISSEYRGVVISQRDDSNLVKNRYQTAYGHNRETLSSIGIHGSQLLSAKNVGGSSFNSFVAVYRRYHFNPTTLNMTRILRDFTLFSYTQSYNIGDKVLAKSRYFESLTNGNHGNFPVILNIHGHFSRVHASWKEVEPIYYIKNDINDFISGITYSPDSLVKHNDVIYQALDSVSNSSPGAWEKRNGPASFQRKYPQYTYHQSHHTNGYPDNGWDQYSIVKLDDNIFMSTVNKNYKDLTNDSYDSAKTYAYDEYINVNNKIYSSVIENNLDQLTSNQYSTSVKYTQGDKVLHNDEYFRLTALGESLDRAGLFEESSAYDSSNSYSLDDLVQFEGEILKSNVNNNQNRLASEYMRYVKYAVGKYVKFEGKTYKSYVNDNFQNLTGFNDYDINSATYVENNKVKYNNNIYKLKVSSTGQGTLNAGYVDSDDNFVDSNGNVNSSGIPIDTHVKINYPGETAFDIYKSVVSVSSTDLDKFDNISEYDSDSVYSVGDYVRKDNNIYKAVVDTPSELEDDSNDWVKVLEKIWQLTWELRNDWQKVWEKVWELRTEWQIVDSTWSASNTYNKSDMVVYNNEVFVSFVDANNNNTPGLWTVKDSTEWSSSQTYSQNDYVIKNYKLYQSSSDGNTEDPDTSSNWNSIEIKNLDNDNKTIETFATINYIWPSSGQWSEFVLISTNSPNYDELDEIVNDNLVKQSQQNIANKSSDDLTNWNSFASGLSDVPTILIQNTIGITSGSNSIMLVSNNNEKLNVLKFKSVRVSNGGGSSRYIHTKNNTGCAFQSIELTTSIMDKNNVAITALPSSPNFRIRFSTVNNVYMYGKNNSAVDKTDVFLIKNIDPDTVNSEVEYNHFNFNYDGINIVPDNTTVGNFNLYSLKTNLDINHVEALTFIQVEQWLQLDYDVWDSPIYSENQIVKVTDDSQDKYYKAKQDIKTGSYNPSENSQWTEIPTSDNSGHNDTTMFATAIHNYYNAFFTEFVLISTDSPSYGMTYPYYDEASETLVYNGNGTTTPKIQSQRHILNTRSNDLSNWKSFCDNFDDSSQVRFQKEGNYVLLYSVDINNKLSVIQFTSLRSENGGGSPHRHIYVDKSKSQVLLYTSNIDDEAVFNETDDQLPSSLNNYDLSYHNGNLYAVRYENNKMNVFLFSKLVDNNILKNKPGIIYNNFVLKDINDNEVQISPVIDTKVVLNKDDLLDPDMYILDDQNLYFINMKSYNLYSSENMKEMFSNAYNFSNPFNGLVYFVTSDGGQTFKEIEFKIVTQQNKYYLKYIFMDEQHNTIDDSGNVVLIDYATETDLYFSVDSGVTKTRVRDENGEIVNTPRGGISNFITFSVTDMNSTFKDATKLFISLENWKVINVTDDGNFNALSNENDVDYGQNGLNNPRITQPQFNILIKSNRNELLEALYYRFRSPGSYHIDYGYLEDWILSSSITDLSNLTDIDLLARAAGVIDENETLNESDRNIMMNNIKSFNDSLSKWNVQHIRTFQNMLKDCEQFNNKNGQNLSAHWTIYPGANLSNMFNGCLVYTDDITSFFVTPYSNNSSFEYYTHWKNAAFGAPNVYFKPAQVENASVSLNGANLNVSWNNGEYYPDSDRLKFDIHITKKNPDGIYESVVSSTDYQPLDGETSIDFSGYDFSGELKIKIQAKSFPTNSNNTYSALSDETILDVIITNNNGIVELTQERSITKEFIDSNLVLNLKWTYNINEIERTSNGVTSNIVELNTTEIEDMNSTEEPNVKLLDSFGLSINFENGNKISYVTLNSNSTNVNLVLANSVSDANKIIVNNTLEGTTLGDLYNYDTAIYHTSDENGLDQSFVLLRKNGSSATSLTLYCVDHQNSNTIYSSDVPINSIIGSSLVDIRNISIAKDKLSFVARYNTSGVEHFHCMVVGYSFLNGVISLVKENNEIVYDIKGNVVIGQLYHDGTELITLNTNGNLILYNDDDTQVNIDMTSNPLTVDNVLTVHFKSDFELVVGTTINGPQFYTIPTV